MWCQWVKSYLLKGKSFWAITVPSNPSWVWSKLLPLKDALYPLIRYKIGNREDTFLWYDNWHPFGSLWSKYGNRLMCDTALNAQSKVASVLGINGWTWPNASSSEVREIIAHTPSDSVPTSGCHDKPIWLLHNDGKFSIGSVWNSWRMKWPKVSWANLVWSPYSIPKVGFIVWMAILGRLNTGDRLAIFGINPNPVCPLCGVLGEDHDHLFFKCAFPSTVWAAMLSKCNTNWYSTNWLGLMEVVANDCRGKSIATIIKRLAFSCIVYHAWLERNNRIFSNERKPEEILLNNIICMVRYRALALSNIKKSPIDTWFLQEYRLPSTILKIERSCPLCGLSDCEHNTEG